jgi:ankyrin repeat protein
MEYAPRIFGCMPYKINPLFSCTNTLERYKELIAAGTNNINDRDSNGNTALFFVDLRSYDKLKLFIDSGADINIKNILGKTVFHYICDIFKNITTDDEYDILKLFIDSGLDLNIQDTNGTTCLMALMGVGIGDAAIATLLKNAKFNPLVRDNDDYTAIDHAKMNNYFETYELIYLR